MLIIIKKKTIYKLFLVGIIIFVSRYGYSQKYIDREIDLKLNNTSIIDLIEILRSRYRIPISFIQSYDISQNDVKMNVNFNECKIYDCMKGIIAQDTRYKFDRIENHLVVYPNEKEYNLITNYSTNGIKARVNAISEFVNTLKDQIPKFVNLDKPILNNPKLHSIYSGPVDVQSGITVIQCFMQLLGKNPYAIISVERTDKNDRMQIKILSVETMNYLTSQVSIDLENASMKDVIEYFRQEYVMPISFIEAKDNNKRLDLKYIDWQFIKIIYELIHKYYPEYFGELINNHYVIYPGNSIYQINMGGISEQKIKRINAIKDLFKKINIRYPIYESYIIENTKDNDHEYENEFVILKDNVSIIKNMVNILGDNYFKIFTITKNENKSWNIYFNTLE